jgi:hypothetical protein
MCNAQIHAVLDNKVPAINDKLNAINYGGCGILALELHKSLKSEGFDSSIVLVNYCYTSDDVDDLIRSIGMSDINSAYQHVLKDGDHDDLPDLCLGHICVQFDGKLYDSDGEFDGHSISGAITAEIMEELLTLDCWNDTFKGNNSGKDITDTMESFFESLFNEHLAT